MLAPHEPSVPRQALIVLAMVADAHVVQLLENHARVQCQGHAGSRDGTILPIMSSSHHTVSQA
jgi:hypothetical protein